MISITNWSREALTGGYAWATFALPTTLTRPVVELRLDAIGDGQPGVTIRGDDLKHVTGMRLRMTVPGTHRLVMWSRDADGCEDETTLERLVVVTR